MNAATFIQVLHQNNVPFLVESKPHSNAFVLHVGKTKLNAKHEEGFLFHPFLVSAETPVIQLIPEVSVDLKQLEEFDFKQFISTDSSKKFELETADFSSYANQFEQYLRAFGSTLKKAILSRVVEVKQTLDFTKILQRLKEFNSATYRYIFYHPISGIWLGVTPELLMQSTGSKINTVSLAGTKPVNSTQPWGEKEREEQAYVTHYIGDVLHDLGYENIVFDGPKTSPAPPVEHLKTYISAQHNSPEMHNKLLQHLHPTPAVCGVPKQEALQLIQSVEPHKRYYYTGFFGWTIKQSAEFYVNLRCALYQNNSWNLFVGGGLTAQSNLHDEWNETALKAQTLMAVIN